MKSTSLSLIFGILLSTSTSATNVLQNYWNILTKTASKCPELTEPPYKVNIPHETDCGKFYMCQRDGKIEMSCSSFLEFNSKLGLCDWPNKANCLLEKKEEEQVEVVSEEVYIADNSTECFGNRQLAHEKYCNQYYRCVYGQKVLKICRDNMVFNTEEGRCDFKYNVACESSNRLVDDYLGDYDYYDNFPVQTTDRSTEKPRENDECQDESTVLPHETKCNAYYRCANGKKIEMLCPGILEFNRKLSTCDWPDLDRCDVYLSTVTPLYYDDLLE